jgi:hypothetical protein
LVLRHDVTGEDLGIVERQEITPDMICASVSDDPAVVEAVLRWDRATPSTWRDLVAARLAAQARAGIPKNQMAPLYSGDVEGYLMPIIMRMGKADEPVVLAQMRQTLAALLVSRKRRGYPKQGSCPKTHADRPPARRRGGPASPCLARAVFGAILGMGPPWPLSAKAAVTADMVFRLFL